MRELFKAAAAELKVPAGGLVAASTGIIGISCPSHKDVGAMPKLMEALSPEAESAAEAILTTDTRSKWCSGP